MKKWETNLKNIFVSSNHPETRDRLMVYILGGIEKGSREIHKKSFGNFYQDVLYFIDFFSREDRALFSLTGKTIALIGTNCYEWLIALWAVMLTGNKILLVDPASSRDQILDLLSLTQASILIGSAQVMQRCNFSRNEPVKLISFHDEGKIHPDVYSFHDVFGRLIEPSAYPFDISIIEEKIRNIPFDVLEPILYIHTSGTTGKYKCVGLSNTNLMASIPDLYEIGQITPKDVYLGLMPFYHVLGLGVALSAFAARNPLTLVNEINTSSLRDALRLTPVSVMITVPLVLKLLYDGIWSQLNAKGRRIQDILIKCLEPGNGSGLGLNSFLGKFVMKKIKKELAPCLRIIASTGAKSDLKHLNFFEKMGIQCGETYGLTETGGGISSTRIKTRNSGSVGEPIGGNHIKIKDPNADGIGEIWIRGPSVFSGYLNLPRLNQEIFDHEQYYNTGDIGYIDSRGLLFITGRKKNLIVLPSGKNVYPEELELHYSQSPYIKEIVVLARSEENEEKIHAVIYPNFDSWNGSEPSPETIQTCIRQEIIRLSQGLPTYKRIAGFTITRNEFPKSSNRKVQRFAMDKIMLSSSPVTSDKKETAPAKAHTQGDLPKSGPKDWEGYVQDKLSRFLPQEYKQKKLAEYQNLDLEFDLGMDSILRSELFSAMTGELNIKPDPAVLIQMNTPQKIIDFLNEFSSDQLPAPEIHNPPEADDNLFSFTDLSEEIRLSRIQAIEKKIGITLNPPNGHSLDASIFKGHIENYLGVTMIPTGMAGPLKVKGEYAKGQFYIPMATTEGALVASVHRGIKVINASGGASVRVLDNQIIRTPSFILSDLSLAQDFSRWLKQYEKEIKKIAESTSRFAKLKDMQIIQFGRRVILRCCYDTGDAAGQNMCTKATEQLIRYVKDKSPYSIVRAYLDNNLSGDKKVNYLNYVSTRGRRVTAEVQVPADVIKNYLHTTPEEMMQLHLEGGIGSFLSGAMGGNAHYANMIAAVYIATGQDVASTHESAIGLTSFELEGDYFVASILLPCLVVGTIGGGTGLPSQVENLKIMECYRGPVNKFAEIVAAAVLAGELSICGSHAAGDFTLAHMRFGRK